MNREHWGSKLGFLMAAAGSAIGLGSLWRFPYITGENGGGVFVTLFLLFTFGIGLPLFIAELVIGRRTQKGPVDAMKELGHNQGPWQPMGWLYVFTNTIILSIYSVVSGWGLHYLTLSLQDFTKGLEAQQIASLFDVLYQAPDLNIFWHAAFMLLTVGIVIAGIKKGIEFWSQILTPTLFILLIALLGYCMTLKGFYPALKFVFLPRWEGLTPNCVLEALGMAFFNLSVGLGILITYGSYMRPTQSIPSIAGIVAFFNVVVSLLASVIIFSLIFTFEFASDQGPGLVFKVLPSLFEQLPGTHLVSSLFFAVLVLTALTSSISILEVLVTTGMEVWGWSRAKSACFWGTLCFIIGIPSALSGAGMILPSWKLVYGEDFFSNINRLPVWLLTFGALAVSILSGWVASAKIIRDEYLMGAQGLATRFYPLWKGIITWLCPLAIFIVMLQKFGLFT